MRYITMAKLKYLVAEDYENRGTSRVIDPTVHEQDNHTSLLFTCFNLIKCCVFSFIFGTMYILEGSSTLLASSPNNSRISH